MTTYQDPPLQSRRASRQAERPEAQPSSPFAPPQVPRTAAGAGEPLSYVTQNRPPLPGYDTAPPHGRRSSEPQPVAPPSAAPQFAAPQPVAPTPAAPETSSEQNFRPRDFSPEARTAPPAWTPEYDRDSGMLDHHTQARAAVPAPAPAAGSLAASLASEPSEQTLSRRELRAIRDAAGIPTAPDTTPVSAQQAPVQQPSAYQAPAYPSPQLVEPPQPAAYAVPVAPQPVAPVAPQPAAPAPQQSAPPAPAPSTQLDSAMAEFDALAGRAPSTRRAGRRAAPQSDVAPEDGLSAFAAPPAPAGYAPQPAASPEPYPTAFSAPAAPAIPESTGVEQYAPAEPVAPPAFAVPSTTGERPVGHWTNQSDLDDAQQVTETTISRAVGSGAITTSALVLPAIPGADLTTGEVLLTGSISLPSSLASTGAHHSIDESDIDHLLDPGDHQLVNTDSVPIRAIRAVSSHTSTRGVIGSPQPKKTGNALTALIVSASVMVVVVVTLLVVALATEVI